MTDRLVTALILGEIVTSVLGIAFFLAGFGNPNRVKDHRDRVMAWHLWLFSLFTGVEMLSLLLLGFNVKLPLPVYALVFGAMDSVIWWRFALLLQYSPPPAPPESENVNGLHRQNQ